MLLANPVLNLRLFMPLLSFGSSLVQSLAMLRMQLISIVLFATGCASRQQQISLACLLESSRLRTSPRCAEQFRYLLCAPACTLAFLLLAGMAAQGADFYFGGTGDTNSNWVGYRVCVATNSFTWTAYTLDLGRRGRIQVAPATFTRVGSNTWTAVFDEQVRRGNSEVYGLAQHEIEISIGSDRQSIRVRDGKEAFDLLKMSRDALRDLDSGRIPNPGKQRT